MIINNIVYTYYENISLINNDQKRQSSQYDLIELCKKSWESNGWDLIVLDHTIAQKHPYYSEYSSLIQSLPSTNPLSYDYHCYMRWLAMSVVGGGLMIDYDVVNYDCSPNELYYNIFHIDKKLTIMQNHTPCAVYGTEDQYLDMCKKFVALKDDYRCYQEIKNKLHTSDMLMIGYGVEPQTINMIEYVSNYPDIDRLVHCPQKLYAQYNKTKYEMMLDVLSQKEKNANTTTDIYRFQNINELIIKYQSIFDMFDYRFYLSQSPSIVQQISLLPSNWNIKTKFFYHYISNQFPDIYPNQQSYDTAILGELIIDSDFDEIFYANFYPETQEYYNFSHSLLSNKNRLFHHYINYKNNNNPQYYFKNNKEWSKSILGLSEEPPDYFDANIYATAYKETNQYFMNDNIQTLDQTCRMYKHYLQHGKKSGYSVNHKMIPVFYHIPKCGGTSIHYGLMIPSLCRQYAGHITNKIYNINFVNSDNKKNYFSVICYIKEYNKINKIPFIDIHSENYKNHNVVDINIDYDTNHLSILKDYFQILAMIINPSGFAMSNDYISNIIDKQHESYIILRKPLSWHQSIFYYLRDIGKWEYTSHMFDKDMSFADYVHSDSFTDSWIIRNFVNTNKEITEKEYELCKQKLDSFTHVGFLEKFQDTTDLFLQKYNWFINPKETTTKYNSNNISQYKDIGPLELYKINQQTIYDNKLYEYFYQKTYGNK